MFMLLPGKVPCLEISGVEVRMGMKPCMGGRSSKHSGKGIPLAMPSAVSKLHGTQQLKVHEAAKHHLVACTKDLVFHIATHAWYKDTLHTCSIGRGTVPCDLKTVSCATGPRAHS